RHDFLQRLSLNDDRTLCVAARKAKVDFPPDGGIAEFKSKTFYLAIRRGYSMAGQRSITTVRPASRARFPASSCTTPSCVHRTFGLGCMASTSSTIPG